MFWRKDTTEEIEELRGFVEGMKRGQTFPTNDSLLETLRQIHDRREAPIAGHDHKRMLQERLRREMRVRAGEQVDDAVRVPEFTPAGAGPRRFLQWAVAASLIFHVGLGACALAYLRFESIFFATEGGETAQAPEPPPVIHIVLPILDNRPDPRGRVTVDTPPSAGHNGNGRETGPGTAAPAAVSAIPVASSSPVGPPVAPGGAPIVPGFATAGLDSAAERGLPEDGGPALAPPPSPEDLHPFVDVSPSRFDKVVDDFDVAPKFLNSPKPTYTTKALEYGIKGFVRVSAVFAADGTVRDIQVIHSLGYGLDEAAIDAVHRMKFTPAMRGGIPVTVRTKVDIQFGLR
jgi:periplasmic protein TonB